MPVAVKYGVVSSNKQIFWGKLSCFEWSLLELFSPACVHCCRAIGPFNASEDLPIDCEDAFLLWMNKVSLACVKHLQLTTQHSSTRHNHSSVSQYQLMVSCGSERKVTGQTLIKFCDSAHGDMLLSMCVWYKSHFAYSTRTYTAWLLQLLVYVWPLVVIYILTCKL